jgi:electron-transferring-flavoprotein dehydrogenase
MAEDLSEHDDGASAALASEGAAGSALERPAVDVDIACVGFGPAMAGFLTTLSQGMEAEPALQSTAAPGGDPQVVCYERADEVGFGVSGVVTRGRAIRASFPDFDPAQIPMAAPVRAEKLVYLLDPIGASRRGLGLRAMDGFLRLVRAVARMQHDAVEIPWIPKFLRKNRGFILSLGQFNQWVAGRLVAMGKVQVWPATPVAEPLVEDGQVRGVRLMDQGTDRDDHPIAGFAPGMDVRAALTVVGDGPVGAVSQQLDAALGMPQGHKRRTWALGMKMVVDLPEGVDLEPGTVFHTIGYPEPEIFGFFYVHPARVASVGIFVPSSFDSPARTVWRYLQHYMRHPYLWRYLRGGKLRSWGAKSLEESGLRGEPRLAVDGCARIGEGSGTTNVLTGSGVDEAWYSGVLLAEGVLELWRAGQPFTRENLESAYVERRRASWLDREARTAAHARDGFERGFFSGMAGMALAGLTGGRLHLTARSRTRQLRSLEEVYRGKLSARIVEALREDCRLRNRPLHDTVMRCCGWPEIPYDGQLLLSLQDALLLGGKVQAPPGYRDHVRFRDAEACRACEQRTCVEMCSGEAIHLGEDGLPDFDREKCVHCGACLWNCTGIDEEGQTNLVFGAGAGGLHAAEN